MRPYSVWLALIAFILIVQPTDAAPSAIGGGDQLLVWEANGIEPGNYTDGAQRGQVAYLDGDTRRQPLIDVPAFVTRVEPCSDQAVSPNGRHFLLYVGNNINGDIYVATNTDQPESIGTVDHRACLGMGTLQWSPDSDRFALIDFNQNLNQGDFARGTLRVFDVESPASALLMVEDVTAFDLTDSGLVFVEFLDGNALLQTATYDGETSDIVQIFPDSTRCGFRSSALVHLTDDLLALLMGQSCTGRVTWELYTVDLTDQSAVRRLVNSTGTENAQNTAYSPGTQTLTASVPDGAQQLFVTHPDGVVGLETARGRLIDLRNPTAGTLLMETLVMPSFSSVRALPKMSTDGRYIALVTDNPSGADSLVIFDHQRPETPYVIPTANRVDVISGMAFATNADRLFYVSGGTGGDENALFVVDLGNGESQTVVRGRFDPRFAVSPDGNEVAVAHWNELNSRRYLNLDIVDVGRGTLETLVQGATIQDERAVDRTFRIPFSWRP